MAIGWVKSLFVLTAGGAVLGTVAAAGGNAESPIFFEPVETTRELVIAIIILAIAIQTNEDLTCIAAGILVSDGFIGYWWAVLGCFIGIVGGDVFLYLMGRYFGGAALKWKWMQKIMPASRVAHWGKAFQKRGFSIIVLSRFVPGSRFPVYFTAGMLRMVSGRFLFFLCLAAVVWTPFLVGVSVLLGQKFLAWMEAHRGAAGAVLIGTVVLVYLIIHQGIPLLTWRGRRLALGFWRRVFRWNYWPRIIFYPPVVLFLFWQMLKRFSVTLLTSTNPGMTPGRGSVIEQKSEVFKSLAGTPELPPWKLLGIDLGPDSRTAALLDFMEESELKFPVVLKPNFGKRGNLVSVIQSKEEAVGYFDANQTIEIIAQAYADGVEFGVFYIRQPDEKKGQIFSITDKRYPFVVGDGSTTLETLILKDDVAVCMGKRFLKRMAGRIGDIPKLGEKVQLTKLGTHRQGAIFHDGRHLQTPELESAIERISRGFDGFYFGRFDIKAASTADFRAAKNLTIIELNGLTSEAAHIYDPKASLWMAYLTLFRQWRQAFEIAAKNRAAGVKTLSFRETAGLIFNYLRNRW